MRRKKHRTKASLSAKRRRRLRIRKSATRRKLLPRGKRRVRTFRINPVLYNKGYDQGYDEAFNEGYNAGYAEAMAGA